jgi:tetratricopeptide (TPR) repeat protein/DNA-binding XRE family transcriptional regulator
MDVGTFGELLAALRKQHHVSQNELATKLDVHRNTISNWERGTYLPETKTLVMELAKHLHLNEHETRQLLEASLTTISPYWLMPYQRNPFFTGRDGILPQLHSVLTHERRAVLSQSYALSGLGGIGKTQTAIEYSYRYANEYTAVFWINAETNASIFSSFVAIADLLNLPEKQDKEQSRVIAAVTRWLTSHSGWLVIFDNVEDLELVKSVLPPARSGSLLFTSRQQALGFTTQTLDLEQMTLEEGTRFLLHRARLLDPMTSLASFAPEDIALAREIVGIMDGLPLALDQAGAYIEATQCNLADYLRLLQSSQLHLLDERDAYADHPLSVVRTFTLTFERLEQSDQAAAELLTVCAFLAPDAIPETFFLEGAAHLGPTFEALSTDSLQFNAALRVLLTYSLLQRNPAMQTLTIHRLVQVVLKERLSEAMQEVWARRVLRAMEQLFPHSKSQASYWDVCKQLLPHALVCVEQNEQNGWWAKDEVLPTLMCHIATYFSNRAHYAQAESLYRQALAIGEQVLDFEHPLMAEVLYGLAMLYSDQGIFEEAKLLHQQALCIRERTLGAKHPSVAISLNMLAEIYRFQGKYEEAEPVYKRALRIWEEVPISNHPAHATLLNNLGVLYVSQGKYEEARLLYVQALRILEQVLGFENPQVAYALNNLGVVYAEQGKREEAESFFKQALRIREQVLGPEHPQVIYPLNNLAELYTEHYAEQGRYEEAELLYKRALQIGEKTLGSEHSQVACSLSGLATIYREQGKYEEAESLYQRALAVRQQHQGQQHPDVAETLQRFAHFYQMRQQNTEALSLYQQALAIREQVLGYNHPKTQETRNSYSALLQAQGWYNEDILLKEAQSLQGVDDERFLYEKR